MLPISPGASARLAAAACALATALAAAPAAAVPAVPAQFKVDTIGSGFDTPTAIAFLPGGRLLVAEKRGRVYTLTNGVKGASPLWSRQNEVLNHHDRGLLGIAVDPAYAVNRTLYFLFTVDPDSNGNDSNNDDAFGRIVRYQVSAADSNVVDYSTRTVLLGRSWRHGPLSASPSHTIGALRFGADGSLLVSIGDGASYSATDAGGLDPNAFGSGAHKTDPYEDIGAFRAQSLTSLCGKILRIDPANGHGYPSNPYWDGSPTSIRSRVWAYGLRNPFRFGVRPGTGSSNPADGDPGTLYIGDVGWGTWEDQNVVRVPGVNFGWPCYEGPNPHSSYQAATPAHNGCGSFGDPDNPAFPTAPDAWWHHSNVNSSQPPGKKGNAAVGGAFYTGTRYPGEYRGAYFFADYGQSWIQVATYDGDDQLVSIRGFGTAMDAPVDLVADPVSGDIHYVAITSGQVRRIRYTGTVSNLPPVAAAGASPSAGVAPLAVTFSSAGSSDPDGDPIGFAWDFGDGGYDTGPSPTHVYAAPGSFAAVLTVTDGRGGLARDTVRVVALASGDFPTTPVVDDFDRPDGPVGGAWTGSISAFRIAGNALAPLSGFGSGVWDGGVFGPNQEAHVVLEAVTAGAPEHDLMLKVQGTSWSAGHVEVRYDAIDGHVAIGTYLSSTGWRTHAVLTPVTLVAGDRFGARALADGSVEVFRNGVSIGGGSVASWPFHAAGGRIGITTYDAGSSRLDDFGGGEVAFTINTPPVAAVLAPAPGSFFAEGDTIRLIGDGTDAEDALDQLEFRWRVDLHHNTHVHPSAFVSEQREDVLVGENHDDGTGIHLMAYLVVTDRLGLADTAAVAVYPEVNLRPSALTALPPHLFAGLPAEYRFELENTGRMPSPQVHWILHTEEAMVAEGDTLVPPLDRVVVTRWAPAPTAGYRTLRVVVDSAAAVVETDETDNHAVRELAVGEPSLSVEALPAVLALSAARPNPAAGAVRMTLELPAAAPVGLEVFDLQGRAVWRAPARLLAAGRWPVAWPGLAADGRAAPAGVYLAVVTAGERTFRRRIVRVR